MPTTARVRRAMSSVLALGVLAALLAPGSAGAAVGAAAVGAGAVGTPKPCPTATAHPWCDRSLSPDARAALFLGAMTLDEQVMLVGGQGLTNNGVTPGGHTGATYAVPRLGLPAVNLSDGPVGPRQGEATALPVPHALAATWDEGLASAYGAEIGDEAKRKGNDVVLAPTVNLMRTPQNGRTYEAYGEETYLVARTGVEFIKGMQAQGVIADVKHFAANNQEGQDGAPPLASVNGGRQIVNAVVDERTLREVYFPHFEAAVKQADVGTLMCAYPRVNGQYACQNSHNLQQVLRKEWGFQGVVLSDYAASKDTVNDMNNGLDFVPANGSLDQSYQPAAIHAALASGLVTRSTLEGHVKRILRTLFKYGFFDRAGYANDDTTIDVTAHERLAQTVEERAITLLKNSGVLPLQPTVKKIAVIGPYADRFVTGGGSGGVKPRSVITALQGIINRAGRDVTVTYADGSDHVAAAALARAADVAVLVVGDVQTEGQDKDCVGLNCPSDLSNSNSLLLTSGSSCAQEHCPINGADQDGLISAVAAAQSRTVVVLETGGPVLTPWRNEVAAVVAAWYPGDRGGAALARVLFGDVDASGRLPSTFPASADQLPTAGDPARYPGVAEEVHYDEKLLVGYRWYDAKKLNPAYAFGSGLSYTTFRYGPLTVTAAHGSNQVAVATLDVTNTGARAGTAVPELYVSKPGTAALPQPVRQLVGYTSVSIPAGATVRVSLPLNDRSFASWAGAGWAITPGCYLLAAGESSRSLPSRTTLGRGPGCAGATVQLGATGDFALPLPAPASVRVLAASVSRAVPSAQTVKGSAAGTLTPQPGSTQQYTDGVNSYRVYTPQGYQAGQHLPLYVMAHGCNTHAAEQEHANLLNPLADREHFVVLYVDHDQTQNAQTGMHPGRCWHFYTGGADQHRGAGDPATIARQTEIVASHWSVDRSRIYLTGMSSGAMMATNVAAAYPDVYAAVAVVAGCAYAAGPTCVGGAATDTDAQARAAHTEQGSRARVVPVLAIQGDSDKIVSPKNNVFVIEQAVKTANLSLSGALVGPISLQPTSSVIRHPAGRYDYLDEAYRDLQGRLVAQRIFIYGMDHDWPGGESDAAAAPFTDPKGPSGAELTWGFLSPYRLVNGQTASVNPHGRQGL